MNSPSAEAFEALQQELGQARAERETALAEARETLERQVATAEVLRVIGSSMADPTRVFEKILDSCEQLFGAKDGAVTLVEPQQGIRFAAVRGESWAIAAAHPAASSGTSFTARAIQAGKPIHVPDASAIANPSGAVLAVMKRMGNYSALYAPMLLEGRGLGAINIARVPARCFSEKEIALLAIFADQAAIAIENARLFNETKEALEQQTSIAEILRVMSSSPTDVTPVFNAIAERARALTGARIGSAVRFDGELLHLEGFHGTSPEAEAAMRAAFPMKPGKGSLNARAIAAGVPMQIPDVLLDPEYQLNDVARKAEYRSLLVVPMIHEGRAIGAIGLGRDEPGHGIRREIGGRTDVSVGLSRVGDLEADVEPAPDRGRPAIRTGSRVRPDAAVASAAPVAKLLRREEIVPE